MIKEGCKGLRAGGVSKDSSTTPRAPRHYSCCGNTAIILGSCCGGRHSLLTDLHCCRVAALGLLRLQTQAGLPLVTGEGPGHPTRCVHTYGPAWALQGEGYRAVWYRSGRLR
jgi:xanthine/CO dehydrogenase XdhC/CoxF family maturation factor